MPNQEPVYIIGHQNPDADSICSAIAYASYKEAKGEKGFVAARCGNSNARIDAILDRFKIPLPVFVGDVTPRVRDIMVTDIHQVEMTSTCAEALDIIDKNDTRALPVVDADGNLRGLISVFQLGEFFIPKPKEPRRMRHVHTSLDAIARSLNATVLHLVEPNKVENLYVRVGAMEISSFGKFTHEEHISPTESIIVVGDRTNIQEKSIEMGVRLLVITGGLPVEQEVIEKAAASNVSIMISPYDSATTSWIIRSATQIHSMVQSKVTIFSPDEPISKVRRKLGQSYSPLFFVTDDKRKLIGIFSESDLLKQTKKKIVLVDHNELGQAVPGANEVTILEIIDHHKLGNIHTNQPILFRNEPVGSTCTIVASMFRKDGITPTASVAGVMMAGIISDTLHLNSPTTTSIDAEILAWLSKIAAISSSDLAKLIFSSGSVILSNTPDAVIQSDCKLFEEGEFRYSISQVEELGFENFWNYSTVLSRALEEHRKEENLNAALLFVTDINSQNSLLVVQGNSDFIDAISYAKVDDGNIFDLPGIVSRKKQLIPYITTMIAVAGLA